MATIQPGDVFPDFVLLDQDGHTVSNQDLMGSKVVLFFYPKDDTPGCTTEACEFRDSAEIQARAKVFGVSPDDAKSHAKFAKKHGFGYPLLADTEHALSEAVGVWVEKSMYGKTYMGIERTTFVLDEAGVVQRVFAKVKPQGHAAEVLASL